MSDHSHTSEYKAEFFNAQKAGALARICGALGVVSAIVSFLIVLLGWSSGTQFAFSWLFAVLYFFTIACGALFWTLVHHATDAEWSVLVRRQLENVAALIPALGVIFFVGIFFAAPLLFKWWTIPHGVDELLDKKSGYLNHGFFIGRAIFYFVALGLLAVFIRKYSVRQDTDGAPVCTIMMRKLSFLGIPLLGLSLTFAAFDWLMSLEFHWASTMWGVYIFGGGAGAAMCLLVLIVAALKSSGHLKMVNIEHYHVMGKLMLAFCIFWAYIGFSQYMLTWYANIPEETVFFIRRNTESWWYYSLLLVIGRFFIPFPVLLFQGTKKNPKWLCIVAGWLLLMQALDIYVIVLPMLHHQGADVSILDITSLLGVGGILGFVFLKLLPKSSLFPVRDPRLPESVRLSN